MRKLILIIVFLLLPVFVLAQGLPLSDDYASQLSAIPAYLKSEKQLIEDTCVLLAGLNVLSPVISPIPADSCVTTNITFWWRAEALDFSGGNGTTDYSAADDIAEVLSAGTIAAVGKMGNGIDLPTSSDTVYFNDGAIGSMITSVEGRLGFWLRYTTWAANGVIVRVYDNDGSYFTITMTNSDELTFNWRDNYGGVISYETTGDPVAACEQPSWCFVEVAWKPATNYREIFFDGVSKGSSSAAIDAFAGDPVDFRFSTVGAGSGDVHIDNPIVSSVSTDDLNSCKDENEWPE